MTRRETAIGQLLRLKGFLDDPRRSDAQARKIASLCLPLITRQLADRRRETVPVAVPVAEVMRRLSRPQPPEGV